MAFEIVSESKIDDFQTISSEISQNLLNFVGEQGAAEAGFTLIKEAWNSKNQRGILMLNDTYVKTAQTALTLTDKIQGSDVMIRSLGISGILKKLKQQHIAI